MYPIEGWLLRVHAKTAADAEARAQRVVGVVTKIRSVSNGPVVVLIPEDKDGGFTYRAATAALIGVSDVYIERVAGSPNTDVLNRGLAMLDTLKCTHAIVVSNKAVDAITTRTMKRVWSAFSEGAKVVGVAFDEFAPFLQEGLILNTFAAYELKAALEVGGFSYEHKTSGVEEVSLLIPVTKRWGRCLALVESSAGVQRLDTPEAQARARELKQSKWPRVHDLLDAVNLPRDYLKQFLIA